MNDEEYLIALEKKLDEEVSEYQKDKSLEEMANILEILYAICEARGGFKDRIFMEYVEE